MWAHWDGGFEGEDGGLFDGWDGRDLHNANWLHMEKEEIYDFPFTSVPTSYGHGSKAFGI